MIRLSKESHVDKGSVVGPSAKKPRHSESSASTSTGKTKSYKDNLRFNKLWYTKWPWMEYCHQTTDSGMICKICKVYGTPPPQARGAWVSRPISNWPKAPELPERHQQSEWHKAVVQCQVMADITQDMGDIVHNFFKLVKNKG